MRGFTKTIRHTHIVGDDTAERIVTAAMCPALASAGIALTGLTDAGRGYEMVRVRLACEGFLVCVGGEGLVLQDDRWRPCRPGQAYIGPAHHTHAFRTVGRRRWQFCWVIYDGPKPGHPLLPGGAPRVIDADPRGLWASIEGLHREIMGAAEPCVVERWAGLVVTYANRVADPHSERDPLWRLWAEVMANLAADWSLAKLADHALMSTEHLRRLCLRHTTRTPMEHVTQLRMARAAVLLETTPMKIAAIARAVGYTSQFAFSTAFRRIQHVSPGAYRRRAAAK